MAAQQLEAKSSVARKSAPARVTANAPAQLNPVTKPQTGPWLYRGSDVPQDKEWIFGELPNGLRYAVRKNGVPPGQVSIRVRVDAGSLNETDDERGFAHLIEHLVFRQSRYLGEAQAIPTWQRLGATFGSDTNAETTPTSTTYKIDLPDASPANLEESFKLLSGMMIAPTLSDANIRAELPIVLAEKRERGGAAQRVQDAMRQVIYKGQPLSVRAPIGTEQTLNAARQDTVRAFHGRWYRPENTVVIVAGDTDPATQAALVAKYFGDWPVNGPHVPTPSFGDPVAPKDAIRTPTTAAAPIGEAQILVEPDLPRAVSWAILRPWRQVNDTVVYNQGLMADSLAQQIINRRLEARARAGGSYLLAQVSQQDVSRSDDGTFISVTPLTNDWQSAVRDVRAVIADALQNPPTAEEIAREAAEMEVAFASSVEQRSLLPGGKLADDLGTAIDIRETVAAPDAVLGIFKRSLPLYTPQMILRHTRQLFTGTVTRAVLITPAVGEGDAAALRTALAQPVKASADARLANKPISFADLPPIGAPGKVISAQQTGLSGLEQLEFANGVKALIWPSADEPGRLTVKVRFGAGFRSFDAQSAIYASVGESALVSSGEGPLGQEELDRISTGRKMGFDFGIDDATFTFAANTRRDDLADQLYLLAAKFAMPRWDANPVLRTKAAAKLQYESFATSPQGMLERDLKFIAHAGDPRYKTPTPQELDQVTPEGFKAVWAPILESGPIEVQVFGDVDREATIAALERSFGALKPRLPLPPTTAPATVPMPSGGGDPVVLYHRGDAGQAAAVVSWPTGGGMAGVHESRQLEILGQIFSNRLLDRMREKLGASYAPQVVSSWPLDLANGGSISAIAQLEPKAVPQFFAAADEIAADLVTTPPSADELARVIEPLRQWIARAETSSAFFMGNLEGATQDPSRYAAIRSLGTDFTQTTAPQMQQLAAKYLQRGKSWRVAVVPQGQVVAGKPSFSVTAQ
ncbi:MAG: insulinase family protein [Novosphingobium sp.]